MRVFANLFLVLFLADGGFSLVDELVPLLTPLAPFTGLRMLLASTVIVMAIPLYLYLGIDRRLPKRVFLPQIFFVFICPLSVWIFPALADFRVYGLLMAVTQVLLGVLPLYYLRKGDERSLTMPPEMFSAPFFSIRNSLIFGAVNLFIIPLFLIISALSAADAYMAEYTSGFMHLTPGGLQMSERVYKKDNRTIRLAAMIHIGNREYYEDLTGSIDQGRTIVLAEGVSDARKLLQNSIDYGKMAGFLGLTSQNEMSFRGRIIDAKELESPLTDTSSDGNETRTGKADILRADVDLSDFRPPTILLLNAIGKIMQSSNSFVKGFKALNSWGEKNITPEMSDIIMDDILHRRNLEVIRYLEKSLDRYDTIVIPWGALHMKEIEAEVLKKGFKLQEERERVSIDFWKKVKNTGTERLQ